MPTAKLVQMGLFINFHVSLDASLLIFYALLYALTNNI